MRTYAIENRRRLLNMEEGEDSTRGNPAVLMSHGQIAKIMGTTRQNVQRLERQALWKLRRSGLLQFWKDLKGIT